MQLLLHPLHTDVVQCGTVLGAVRAGCALPTRTHPFDVRSTTTKQLSLRCVLRFENGGGRGGRFGYGGRGGGPPPQGPYPPDMQERGPPVKRQRSVSG